MNIVDSEETCSYWDSEKIKKLWFGLLACFSKTFTAMDFSSKKNLKKTNWCVVFLLC